MYAFYSLRFGVSIHVDLGLMLLVSIYTTESMFSLFLVGATLGGLVFARGSRSQRCLRDSRTGELINLRETDLPYKYET